MSMSKFARGDVVILKSGGMKMTVRQPLSSDNMVGLQWMDMSGSLLQATLPADMLEKVESDKVELTE